jgi:GTP-binding protein
MPTEAWCVYFRVHVVRCALLFAHQSSCASIQGHSFLRHIERCAALILVVDLSAGLDGKSGQRASGQLRMLRDELDEYDRSLADRPMLVVGTKLDMPGAARSLAGLRRSATAAALPRPLGVSSVTGHGIAALKEALLQLTSQSKRADASSGQQ